MKDPILYLLFFCFVGLASGQNSQQKILKLLPQSRLLISGDTNISKFSCNFDQTMLPSTCSVTYGENGKEISFKNAVLVLNNRGFDCGSKLINKDFHALLQTEKFPSIELELKKVYLQVGSSAVAQVSIKIAGKQKEYELPVEVLSNPATCFEGVLELDINDFGLEPPKKTFGLIKVREAINISFNITVAEEE